MMVYLFLILKQGSDNISFKEANDFLKNNGLMCDKIFQVIVLLLVAFKWVIVIDKAGNILNHIDKSNGLQDEWLMAFI